MKIPTHTTNPWRRRPGVTTATLLLAAFLVSAAAPTAAQSNAPDCRPTGPLVSVGGLREGSGLAPSRRVPGRLWTHNDSGAPELLALDERGSVTARLRVTGARVTDWEAIASGPCAAGACLYVADIGDNDAERKSVTIYRVPEPAAGVDTAAVDAVYEVTYPDGPRNAETLLVDGSGRLHIVTKGDTAPLAVYRFPTDLEAGGSVRLERVGEPQRIRDDAASRITDGAVSADGDWVALRTRTRVMFYRASELLAGRWREVHRIDLSALKEPQGEGVAFAAGNALFIAGEGGKKSLAGTFARLTCGLPAAQRETR